MKYQGIAMMALTTCSIAGGFPKYETSAKGIALRKEDYFHLNGDQIAMESGVMNVTERGEQAQESQGRPPRFGFPTYSQDIQPVSNAVPGLYGPVKLDIGGLVLGTIVGLGAFFILPKLFHVVSTPYGGYKRSEDETKGNESVMEDLVTRIQKGLNSYNIDSTSCLQRAVCFSVQTASEKMNNNTANSIETAVDNVAKNEVIKTLIDGTDWKKAVDIASKGEDCSSAFPKCPVEVDTIISAIAKFLIS